MLWATMVGLTGHGEERVWNSFFLQYLWEFCLGMKLAEMYVRQPSALDIPKWRYLVPTCVIGMVLAGLAGWAGYPWKLYNDIPSLVGYVSLALCIYKIGVVSVNMFFSFTNRFSYEWYLVHMLVFQICMYVLKGHFSCIVEFFICLIVSYLVAMGYARMVRLHLCG